MIVTAGETRHDELRARAVPVIARLKERIEALLDPLVRPDVPFALLDFPNHANIGDSAIWLGTLAYFRARTGASPAYVCTYDWSNLDDLERRCPDGPIFLHGGGNFGDIWPWYQTFREAVMARFPGRPIVQLPQTLHFESGAHLRRAADAIRRHGDVTLLVRDRRSLAIAQAAFDCRVELCPDMAFCLGPVALPKPPRADLLLLMRTDRESGHGITSHDITSATTVLETDWPDERPYFRSGLKLRSFVESLAAGEPWRDGIALRESFYHRLAAERVRRGFGLLASARYVITDRLHAHVMSVLLGKPHHVMDNSYGKIAAFVETWTAELTAVEPPLP